MNRLVILILCFTIYGIAQARMPSELRKLFDIHNSETDDKVTVDKLTKEAGDFNLNKYTAQSSEMEAFEAAWKKLGGKSFDQYRPPVITTVECHVEYQMTQKVPGRCIRLPGNIPACQTTKFIGVNYNECN